MMTDKVCPILAMGYMISKGAFLDMDKLPKCIGNKCSAYKTSKYGCSCRFWIIDEAYT